ncbi:MAG: cation:dicarboxylate symporter family transporter [Phascolarctobacterium sp.]
MLQFFYKTIKDRSFALEAKNIDVFSEELEQLLGKSSMKHEDLLKLRLLAETVLINWMASGAEDAEVKFQLFKLMGRTHLELSMEGEPINPLEEWDKFEVPMQFAEMMNSFQSEIGITPVYSYANGCNTVKFKLPEKELSPLAKTGSAAALALVTYGVCSLMPPEWASFISKEVFEPTFNMFMGLMSMLATVMVFASITSSTVGMGDKALLNKYGKGVFLNFQILNFCFTALTIILCSLVFGIVSGSSVVNAAFLVEVYKIILGIVPNNLIKPFLDANTLQLLFMGIAFGCFLLTYKDETDSLIKTIYQFNFAITKLLAAVCKKMHYAVYLSLSMMLLNGSLNKVIGATNIILFECGMNCVLVLATFAWVSWKCRYSFWQMLKDFLPVGLTGCTTASSMATMPIISEICSTKYKVNQKFMNFGVPMSVIFGKSSTGVYLSVIGLYFVKTYGLEVNLTQLVSICVLITLMCSATPPVPGGGIIVLTMVFQQLNLPKEAIAVPITLDIIFDMLDTGWATYLCGAEVVYLERKLGKE